METNALFASHYNRALGTFALIALVLALGAYAYHTIKQAQYLYDGPTTISVSGEGEVLAVPDVGEFTFSVRAEAETAAAAQEASATDVNEIISYLEEAGVEEKDIKNQNYNLQPEYRFEQAICEPGRPCPRGERVLDGFSVTQSVQVKVRDTAQAGELIAGVGERGATNLSGLSFTVDDEEALEAQARDRAIADAKEKARALAEQLDVRLVRIVGYNEPGGRPVPYGRGGDVMMAESADAVVSPQVPTGENRIVRQVNLVYQVR